MAKIRIKGDTSGYIDIATPDVAGTHTLTLPTSGNLLTSTSDSSDFPNAILTSTSVLDSDQIGTGAVTSSKIASGAITTGMLPAGSVLQVAQTYVASTGHIITTSTSLVASGFSVSITPTSTDNFIVIQMFNTMVDHNLGSGIRGSMYVNGSPMTGAERYHLGYQSSASRYASWGFAGKYTPTSLAALTFEPYFQSVDGGQVRFSHSESSISLIAMEIAG